MLELYGVKMSNQEDYDDFKAVISSAALEGFVPTTESVQILVDFYHDKISIATLIEMKNAL
ncbi:hypothetical protein AZF37_08440 [endosymbiont 'TC1' of Trimyema compressum]|uniref:hypothetical protein n=1 Tax=endosymbiont 'TC1' of Trimyema compressum TaxID=243899 RepID=UPI0007F16082|nr:hypothetical protein [endosymbiont 'TC1' of Trimyema compressum]AMP21183.1 hypothetical protein AZF37_08440 [endosymbiont 'TC1' of Trimyema compressum]